MNFSKYLMFGTSLLCASCFVSVNTTGAYAESYRQDENSSYEKFVEDMLAVAKKSGLIDISGINLEKLSYAEYDDIKTAISTIVRTLIRDLPNLPVSKRKKFTLLVSPNDLQLYLANPEDTERRINKMVDMLNVSMIVSIPSIESVKNKDDKDIDDNRIQASYMKHDLDVFDEAFELAKKTNVIDLKKVDSESLTDFELQILEAKLCQFLRYNTFDKPTVMRVYSASHSQSEKDIPESMLKIAESASGYNVTVELIGYEERKHIFQIEDAFDNAYETNVIDLRFLDGDKLDILETTVLLSNVKAFNDDYDFKSGKAHILLPLGAIESGAQLYYKKLLEWQNEHQDKFTLEVSSGDSDKYDPYIRKVVNFAKKTKVLDLSALEFSNLGDVEKDKYFSGTVKQGKDFPKLSDVVNDETTLIVKDRSNYEYFGKLSSRINKIVSPNNDKFNSFVNSMINVCKDVEGVFPNTNNTLVEKLRLGSLIQQIAFGEVTNGFGSLIKAKVDNRLDKKEIKSLVIFGKFDDSKKKNGISCETHNSSEELFDYTVGKINNAKTTSVIDFRDVAFGSFREPKLKNNIQMIKACIAEFLYSNPSRDIKFVIGTPEEKNDKKIRDDVVKGLKELKEPFKNFQIQTM